MSDKTIYLKMDAKIKLQGDVVRIGDLGKIYCKESSVVSKIKTLPDSSIVNYLIN